MVTRATCVIGKQFVQAEFPNPTVCSLRCLKVDTVKAVSNIIPPVAPNRQLRLKIRESMAESMKGRNIRPAYMSLSSEYRRADESLRSLLGENFLEPLPEQDEELFQQDKYRDFWRCIYGAGFFYIAGINVEDCLMVHALGLDVPSGDIPCVVANRKIGVLSGGALGILAPATYPGDEIYAFAVKANPMKGVGDICIHLLVLRPYPIKSITHASHLEYKTKRDNKGGWENIQHFTLVGCAWVGYDCLAMKRAYQIWDRKGFDSRDYEDNAWGDLKTTAWIY